MTICIILKSLTPVLDLGIGNQNTDNIRLGYRSYRPNLLADIFILSSYQYYENTKKLDKPKLDNTESSFNGTFANNSNGELKTSLIYLNSMNNFNIITYTCE